MGWYKFKQGFGSEWKMTLREKILHKQLANLFDTPADLFTLCFLTTCPSHTNSTFEYKQIFIRYCPPIYQNLNMHIENLSDPNTTYRSSLPSSETFTNIVKSLKMDVKKMQGLEVISKIQVALQNQIDTAVKNLTDSERRLHCLEEEIFDLEQKLRDKSEREKEKLENGLISDINSNENENNLARGKHVGSSKKNIDVDSPNISENINTRSRRVKN